MVSEEFNFGSEIRLNTVLCFKISLAGFLIFNTSKSEHSWLTSWVFIGDDKVSWKGSTLQNISSLSDLTVCKMQLNNNTIFRLTNNVQYSALLFKLQIFTSVCFSSAQILLHHGHQVTSWPWLWYNTLYTNLLIWFLDLCLLCVLSNCCSHGFGGPNEDTTHCKQGLTDQNFHHCILGKY